MDPTLIDLASQVGPAGAVLLACVSAFAALVKSGHVTIGRPAGPEAQSAPIADEEPTSSVLTLPARPCDGSDCEPISAINKRLDLMGSVLDTASKRAELHQRILLEPDLGLSLADRLSALEAQLSRVEAILQRAIRQGSREDGG